jgi:hypothetical protein
MNGNTEDTSTKKKHQPHWFKETERYKPFKNIKTMKENELIQLRKTLLNDLLKIRILLKKRIHTELENNTTPYTETDYTINRLITIDEKIEGEINKRLRNIQLKKMYNY